MNEFDPNRGSQAAYDFWLGLIPQFLGQFGGHPAAAPGAETETPAGLPFPLDQIAKAAGMTQQSLQSMALWLGPVLQAGGTSNLLAQWASAAPLFSFGKPEEATPMAAMMQSMMAPWTALMSNAAGAMMQPSQGAGASPLAAWQALGQNWSGMAKQMTAASAAPFETAFDRTYGALSDALGLAPARKLGTAWRDVVATALAQQEARNQYALLVQGAFAQGLERLTGVLADKAAAGERVDSVLALIRLWTVNTEQAVHETLQSEAGLAATAALIRTDLAYRKKMQQVAAVLAEQFQMATRQEVDEAYREIQALKRELRASRSSDAGSAPARAGHSRRPRKAPGTRSKGADQ